MGTPMTYYVKTVFLRVDIFLDDLDMTAYKKKCFIHRCLVQRNKLCTPHTKLNLQHPGDE